MYLYGLTIAAERSNHRLMENWHPLGVVGVITAFNFPVAVWAWNAALALVCGNSVVWKPSEKTPFTALAVQALFGRAAARFGAAPPGRAEPRPLAQGAWCVPSRQPAPWRGALGRPSRAT